MGSDYTTIFECLITKPSFTVKLIIFSWKYSDKLSIRNDKILIKSFRAVNLLDNISIYGAKIALTSSFLSAPILSKLDISPLKSESERNPIFT